MAVVLAPLKADLLAVSKVETTGLNLADQMVAWSESRWVGNLVFLMVGCLVERKGY